MSIFLFILVQKIKRPWIDTKAQSDTKQIMIRVHKKQAGIIVTLIRIHTHIK
jgi:hypothetical protein